MGFPSCCRGLPSAKAHTGSRERSGVSAVLVARRRLPAGTRGPWPFAARAQGRNAFGEQRHSTGSRGGAASSRRKQPHRALIARGGQGSCAGARMGGGLTAVRRAPEKVMVAGGDPIANADGDARVAPKLPAESGPASQLCRQGPCRNPSGAGGAGRARRVTPDGTPMGRSPCGSISLLGRSERPRARGPEPRGARC